MLVAQRLCDNFKTCSNAGRYLAVDGRTLCSLCSMQVTAVRICDLPSIIKIVDTIASDGGVTEADLSLLRYLLPRR